MDDDSRYDLGPHCKEATFGHEEKNVTGVLLTTGGWNRVRHGTFLCDEATALWVGESEGGNPTGTFRTRTGAIVALVWGAPFRERRVR